MTVQAAIPPSEHRGDARSVGLSVIIPTYRRPRNLLYTLREILRCDPAPREILVHVDSGDAETAGVVASVFPAVRLFTSSVKRGPGGARNRLVEECTNPLVVSLDDDSFPIDEDFFAAVERAFKAHPEAGVLAMAIIHDGEPVVPRGPDCRDVGDFVGCGCAYRREAFLQTSGYVPLAIAYGMEEADLALQLLDEGWSIVEVDDLRVRHATDRAHQSSRKIVAAHVSNTALLAFLRYPPRMVLYGIAQVANRVLYSVRRGHIVGALWGLLQIPSTILQNWSMRRPVSLPTIRARRHKRVRSEQSFSRMGSVDVLFLVPFISRAYASDYERACRLLDETLKSLRGQVGCVTSVLVVSNDRPPCDIADHEFLETQIDVVKPERPGSYHVDKERKLALGLVKARSFEPRYVMCVDADDLVHPRLASAILRARSDLVVMKSGFIFNSDIQQAYITPNFFKICGTSLAF